jgi:hypothetical protein
MICSSPACSRREKRRSKRKEVKGFLPCIKQEGETDKVKLQFIFVAIFEKKSSSLVGQDWLEITENTTFCAILFYI